MTPKPSSICDQAEARRAAQFLGATHHESLTNDLEILYDLPTLRRLASVVRLVSPRILLVHSPQDYMEDHTSACRLAVTAAFSRGMPNFPVVPPRPAITQDVTVYHAQPHGNCDPLGQPVHPQIFVDISSVIDRKAQMLSLHQSQQDWLDESQGMDSYVADHETIVPGGRRAFGQVHLRRRLETGIRIWGSAPRMWIRWRKPCVRMLRPCDELLTQSHGCLYESAGFCLMVAA